MATDKNQALSTLRTKVLSETMANEGRNRFALFSQPPAGVWGDGEYNFSKTKTVGSDGKVKTKPRGIFGGPTSSGRVESSYFAKTAYITIGDKYVDPATAQRQAELAKKKKIRHDAQFRPSDGTKTDPFKSVFEHITDHNEKKKNYRGPDGRVTTQPKNIVTNPPRVGHGDSTTGHLLSKGYKHMPDPYNRQRELEIKEKEAAKKKLQEAPFRSVSHGGDNFTKGKETFGRDNRVLMRSVDQARNTPSKVHEAPFKPSNPAKTGYNKTLNKFPEYKPDPIKFAVFKGDDPSKKESYKPNNTAFIERPTPSISLNKLNLKQDMIRISQGV